MSDTGERDMAIDVEEDESEENDESIDLEDLIEDEAYQSDEDDPKGTDPLDDDDLYHENEFIAVEYPLDDIHEEMYDELTEFGVNVEQAIAENTIQRAEQVIYTLYESVKYSQQ